MCLKNTSLTLELKLTKQERKQFPRLLTTICFEVPPRVDLLLIMLPFTAKFSTDPLPGLLSHAILCHGGFIFLFFLLSLLLEASA